MGGGVARERCREALGKVPRDGKLAVPEEVLAHAHRQFHLDIGLVARLLLVVVARDVGAEGNARRKPAELPVAQELPRLFLLVNPPERLERLHVGCPVILEAAAIVVGVLVGVVGVVEVGLGGRVTECEVGRIPRHGVLALHVKLEARYREGLGGALRDGIGAD